MAEDYPETEYEPDWQPVPERPELQYDAKQGEYREGIALRTHISFDAWRTLYNAP